jgi:hypothetical protein
VNLFSSGPRSRLSAESVSEEGPDSAHIFRMIIKIATWVTLSIGCFLALKGVVRTQLIGIGISVYPNSEALKYLDRVGDLVRGPMWLALGLVLLGAVSCFFISKKSVTAALLVAVGLTVAAGLIVSVTESKIDPMLVPYLPELAVIKSFPAPAGWNSTAALGRTSLKPGAEGIWTAPGSVADVCDQARTALNSWLDEGTLIEQPPSQLIENCRFSGVKGVDAVGASVSNVTSVETGVEQVHFHLTIARREDIDPSDLLKDRGR